MRCSAIKNSRPDLLGPLGLRVSKAWGEPLTIAFRGGQVYVIAGRKLVRGDFGSDAPSVRRFDRIPGKRAGIFSGWIRSNRRALFIHKAACCLPHPLT